MQHILFVALVRLCGRARLIGDLDTNIDQINEYVKKWSLNTQQHRSLLRLIHGALINDQRADQAAKVCLQVFLSFVDLEKQMRVEKCFLCQF